MSADSDAGGPVGQRRRPQSDAVFAALVIALLAAFVLLMAPWPQLGPDESAWATSVIKVLKGRVLGQDAVMAKGPYLVLWHLLAYLATGPNVLALHLLGAAWALLTGIVVCLAALRLAGRGGLLATGLLYVAAMADPALRTNVYAEIIMALPLALGMTALAAGLSRRSAALLVLAGLCAGLAVLTKQTAVFSALAMAVVAALVWGRGVGGWKKVIGGWPALALGGLLAAAPWLIYMWMHRSGAEFVAGYVGSSARYVAGIDAAQLLANIAWSLVHVVPRYTLVLVASVIGCVHALRLARTRTDFVRPLSEATTNDGAQGNGMTAARGSAPYKAEQSTQGGGAEAVAYLTACAWYLSAALGVAVTGRFAAHYFSQLFPPAALLGGIWIAHRLRDGAARPEPLAPVPTGEKGTGDRYRFNVAALILAAQLLVLLPVGAMNLGHWRRAVAVTAVGSPWRHVGEYIRARTSPQDTVFVWGDQTEILYWAGREPASADPWITLRLLGFAHQGPLFATRVTQQVDWQGFRDELARWQPAYIVIAPLLQTVALPQGAQFGTDDLPELRDILAARFIHEQSIAGYELYAPARGNPQLR